MFRALIEARSATVQNSITSQIPLNHYFKTDPSRVYGVGLRALACWDCGIESRRRKWMYVSCECYVLSRTGLCVGPITRPEESYRL